MNGTEWTEPGQGATWYSLRCKLALTAFGMSLDQILEIVPFSRPNYIATNLRLTGSPLTAEDVRRIAEAT